MSSSRGARRGWCSSGTTTLRVGGPARTARVGGPGSGLLPASSFINPDPTPDNRRLPRRLQHPTGLAFLQVCMQCCVTVAASLGMPSPCRPDGAGDCGVCLPLPGRASAAGDAVLALGRRLKAQHQQPTGAGSRRCEAGRGRGRRQLTGGLLLPSCLPVPTALLGYKVPRRPLEGRREALQQLNRKLKRLLPLLS